MTESLKLLKHFAAICLILLCGIAMLCGVAVVRSNTRQLSFGEEGQQVGFSFDAEVTTIQAGQQLLEWPAFSPALALARLAPAPIGTWLMVVHAATQLTS